MEAVTLRELNTRVKQVLASGFREAVWITAEITELQLNRSGHCYLQLADKDKETEAVVATARATVWAFVFRTLRPYFETSTGRPLSKGMKVLLKVEVVFHELYGFSLNVRDIDPAYTLGDLERKKREILEKLKNDGVIDMNREKAFPLLPKRIAVISSPTAAGLGDFMDQLEHNTGGYRFLVKLFPAVMQGERCPQSVMSALVRICDYEALFDVVVIIRGGGAQTDLSCFDDYDLASCVANFPLPVISGIGHERDETILDRVACLRVKTPTAAAACLVSCFQEAEERLDALRQVFAGGVQQLLAEERHRQLEALNGFRHGVQLLLSADGSRLLMAGQKLRHGTALCLQRHALSFSRYVSLTGRKSAERLAGGRQRIDKAAERIRQKTAACFAAAEKRLEVASTAMRYADPENILRRGFSITRLHGKVLTGVGDLAVGDILETETMYGCIASEVRQVQPKSGTEVKES